ncbi:MAG TPA: tetratricopeptide repeat protein, partial [Thermoanaerobaculia bacterium]
GRASFGDRHPALAPSLNNLAALEQAMGDRETSRGHFEEALAILRGAYGDGNPSVAMVLHNYAQLLFDLGETEPACARLAEAHRVATAAFGPDHPFTAQLTRQREVRCAGAALEKKAP